MKIETQPRDDHQVTLTVELEADQLEGAKRRAARKISERKAIPGFRPGKAPYEVVLRSYGEDVIVQEAVDLLLDEIYPKALDEAKLTPAASGSLEKVDGLDKKPTFVFNVPLAPTVDLGKYRSVRLPYEWQEPGEDKLNEAMEDLRQSYAKTEAVERPIQKGDFVMIDLKGVKAKAEEGEAPLLEQPSLPVFIRPDEKPGEFPFVGFSNELVGLSVGESKSFTHKYEKDHTDTKLQGQTVKFDVTVKIVRGSILPDLNDEFAKQAGPFADLQALREAVKANLAASSKAEYDDEYFEKVIDKIKEGAAIKYPPQVVDHEVEHVMEDLKGRLAGQGLDLPAYLKSRQTDEEKFVAEEARPVAIKRLERSLLMEEIMDKEDIRIGEDEMKASFQSTWNEYQGDAKFQKMLKGKSQPPKKIVDAIALESANRAYLQQTLMRLKDIATGQAPELEKKEKTEDGKKPATKKTAPKKPASTAKKATGEKKPAAAPAKAKKTTAAKK